MGKGPLLEGSMIRLKPQRSKIRFRKAVQREQKEGVPEKVDRGHGFT